MSSLIQLTEGYSGSDIKLVCKEAAMQPVRKVFDKLESMNRGAGGVLEDILIEPIKTEHVKAAISRKFSKTISKAVLRMAKGVRICLNNIQL